MIYLTLSIICSVTVGVLLKLARRYQLSVAQAITWNYLFAIGLSAFFFRPRLSDVSMVAFSPVHIILGFLLPVIFIFLALSVNKTGLARTDIAQRLSLFLSLLAAYFLFNDDYHLLKYLGTGLAFIAIILTLHRPGTATNGRNSWLYPFLVFVGFGAIDVLFKTISQLNVIPYTSSLFWVFCISFVFALIYISYLAFKQKTKLQFINFICGCILGFFNFGNILFYMKAHRAMANDPSAVFAGMNMGVIILGSLIGIFVFKERLSKINYVGLALALIAIVLITLAQLYAVR